MRACAACAVLAALVACDQTSGAAPIGADETDAAVDAGDGGAFAGAADAGPGPLYAKVAVILERSCAYERCHAGALIGAGLDLSRGSDHRRLLVGVTACEYDRMARVEPGDPERSWLMVKLTAPYRDLGDPYALYIHFTPEPGWDPERRGCPDMTEDGAPLFGQRMPLTAPNMLPDADLAAIRAWIEAGAPP